MWVNDMGIIILSPLLSGPMFTYIFRNTNQLLSSSQEKENTSPTSKSSANKIQIISMSATVGNLKELSMFLESQLYTDSWRPVKLEEYIKVLV